MDSIKPENDWIGLGLNLLQITEVFNVSVPTPLTRCDTDEVEPEKEKETKIFDFHGCIDPKDWTDEDSDSDISDFENEDEKYKEEQDTDEDDDEDSYSYLFHMSLNGMLQRYSDVEINAFLKGLIFVQEMYDEEKSNIETLHREAPDKYRFLFSRGEETDTIVFQGSTAEGLAILKVKGTKDHQEYVHRLKWGRLFDYDIMFIKS